MSEEKACIEKKQTDFDKILNELSKEVERAESFSIQIRDILSNIKNEPVNEPVKDDKSIIECDFVSKAIVLIMRLSKANHKQQSNVNKLNDTV